MRVGARGPPERQLLDVLLIKLRIYQPSPVPIDIAVEVLLDVRPCGREGSIREPCGLRSVVLARGGIDGGVVGRVDEVITPGVAVGAAVAITIVEVACAGVGHILNTGWAGMVFAQLLVL